MRVSNSTPGAPRVICRAPGARDLSSPNPPSLGYEERAPPMMNLFRGEGAGQWIVGAVASVVIVVFVLEFRQGRGATGVSLKDDCAVQTPAGCVDQKDFYAAYNLAQRGELSAKQMKALKLSEQVLDGLTERELLAEEARKLGFGVGEADLNKELTQGRVLVSLPVAVAPMLGAQLGLCMPTSGLGGCSPASAMVRTIPVRRGPDGEFDPKLYERMVRNLTNRGTVQFRKMQEREALAERMRQWIRSTVRISRDEAYQQYVAGASKATAKYVELERDWFGRFAVDLSDKAVDAWLGQHKAQVDDAWKTDKDLWKAGCPLVSEVLLPFPPDVSDADKTALRAKADAALERLTKGKQAFATVAREAGQGDAALLGGSLGCLTPSYGTGADALLEAVKGLAPGKTSAVIESKRGFHILHHNGLLAEAELERVGQRAVARRLAARFLADEALRKVGTRLLELAKAGSSLDDALKTVLDETIPTPKDKGKQSPALADGVRPKVTTSDSFTRDGSPGESFSPFSGVGTKLFGLGKAGTLLPELVDTQKGVAVLSLATLALATREEFEAVSPRLMERMREFKALEALVEHVERLRKAANGKLKVDENLKNLKVRGSDD